MKNNTLKFKTKRDINGNTYSLVVDIQTREMSYNNHCTSDDFITVTKRDLQRIREYFKECNFTEV